MNTFFPGFERRQIQVSGASINLAHGGQGPALLLLHGYPHTQLNVHCFADPAAIHASCEDNRAADSIDPEHDAADANTKIGCPVPALWRKHVVIEQQFDCLADWREVAGDVRGHALDCGHYLPEELPEEVARELENFLG